MCSKRKVDSTFQPQTIHPAFSRTSAKWKCPTVRIPCPPSLVPPNTHSPGFMPSLFMYALYIQVIFNNAWNLPPMLFWPHGSISMFPPAPSWPSVLCIYPLPCLQPPSSTYVGMATAVLRSALAFLYPQTLRTQDIYKHFHLFPPTTYFAQLYHHPQDLSLASLLQEFFLGHCSRHSVVIHFLHLVVIGLAFPTKAILPLFVSLLLFVSFLFTLNSVHTRVASTRLSNGFLENFWECLLGTWDPQ